MVEVGDDMSPLNISISSISQSGCWSLLLVSWISHRRSVEELVDWWRRVRSNLKLIEFLIITVMITSNWTKSNGHHFIIRKSGITFSKIFSDSPVWNDQKNGNPPPLLSTGGSTSPRIIINGNFWWFLMIYQNISMITLNYQLKRRRKIMFLVWKLVSPVQATLYPGTLQLKRSLGSFWRSVSPSSEI